MSENSYESYSSSQSGSSDSSSCQDDTGFSLKVRYTETSESARPIYAYALKAEVVSSSGMPDHIFVYHRTPDNTTGDQVDTFIQIASPLECEEVPENAPRLDEGMPYYRSETVTLWFRCPDDRELAKKKISEDIDVLVRTYKVLNGMLEIQEEKTYE